MAKPSNAGQTRRVNVALLAHGAVHHSRGDIEECVAAVCGFTPARRLERSAKQRTNTTPSPNRKHSVIFEAKTITAENELQQTRRAIGQLLEYRHVHGRKADRICLVTDIALSRQRAQLLDELGIGVLLAPAGATSVTAQNH